MDRASHACDAKDLLNAISLENLIKGSPACGTFSDITRHPFRFASSLQLAAQILLLLVFGGLLVFHYSWGGATIHHTACNVLTYFPDSYFFKHVPCAQAWVVRVESSDMWYLNSTKIAPNDLPSTLRSQIAGRTVCIVYFDAEPDFDYADAILAIDPN